ncbi:hypothetical protein AN958_02133 [Leucoagaricus sp. SymC.cos]|nr:hypothetical protein AN958_02133 [Leucoagaricus sp. SymC.cos]
MSDTAPARPRPKPRPRPRAVPAQKSSAGDASGTNNGASSTISLGEIQIDDCDDLFVVNRRRTKETWRKLDEINEVAANAGSDSESDTPRLTPNRKRPKKDATPQWRKNQENIRLLSTQSSSDSESDLEITGVATPGKGKHKRQKTRSKSRSLTPPPDLPAAVLANARNIIRQAIDSNIGRAPSPTAFDDFDNSTDTVVLDPELQRIAKSVTSQTTHQQSVPSLSGSTAEKVEVHVRWQKHPLNPGEHEPLFKYRMGVDEPFRDLFECVAEDAQVLVGSLVLSYKNKRIFPATRPDSFGIWGGLMELTACHQKTYDFIQQQARELRQTRSPVAKKPTYNTNPVNPAEENVINIPSDDEDADDSDIHITTPHQNNTSETPAAESNSSPPKASQESDAGSESDVAKFKLVLRSNKTAKDITLIVRPTTKCGAIVKAYIKKAGLAEQYSHLFNEGGAIEAPVLPTRGRGRSRGKGRGRGRDPSLPDPRISVDGDKMENDTEIGDADLDDGDMVEVVGL